MTTTIYNNSSFSDSPYGLKLQQTFSSAGTFSVTGIPTNILRVYAVVIGGGGAGATATTGGAGGNGILYLYY